MTVAKETWISALDLQLAAKCWGDPNKPLIIALHGWLDNAGSFDTLAPLLCDDYYVVALDLPGHGHSQYLPNGRLYWSYEYIQITVSAIKALSQQPVILLGHSLGGAIGCLLASSFPSLCHQLILLDAAGPVSEEVNNAPSRLARFINAITSEQVTPHTIYPDLATAIKIRARVGGMSIEETTPLVERGTEKIADGYRWTYDKRLQLPSPHYLSEQQVLAYIAAIKTPTCLILAEDGLIIDNPLAQARLSQFKNLQHQVIFDGHHYVHLKHANQVAETITHYLARQP